MFPLNLWLKECSNVGNDIIECCSYVIFCCLIHDVYRYFWSFSLQLTSTEDLIDWLDFLFKFSHDSMRVFIVVCADVAWLPTTCLTSISLSRTHLGWSKTVHNLTTDTFFPTLAGYIIPGHLIGSGYSSKIPWSFHDNSGSHRNYIFLGIHKFLMPKTGSRRFVGL